jgi:hypothetical protein
MPECQRDYLYLPGHDRAQIHYEMTGFDSAYYWRIVAAKALLDLIGAQIDGLHGHDESRQILSGERTTANLRKALPYLDPQPAIFTGPLNA